MTIGGGNREICHPSRYIGFWPTRFYRVPIDIQPFSLLLAWINAIVKMTHRVHSNAIDNSRDDYNRHAISSPIDDFSSNTPIITHAHIHIELIIAT